MRSIAVPVLLLLCFVGAQAADVRPAQVAILDLGDAETATRAADQLTQAFAGQADFAVVNRAQARAAARGVGYKGSLNLTLAEARDLGAAVGCDFLIAGDAQTLRRSAFDRADYFESYAALFFVSARTGRLLLWEQPSVEAATPEEAERALLAELGRRAARYVDRLRAARARERAERLSALERDVPVIADVPAEGSAEAAHLRPPRPYRRFQPRYTEAAAHSAVEATVDVLADIDEAGEVGGVEVVRWAGYGLDEACVATVRQLHFFPALRDQQMPVPMRVLLRYNFRKPPGAKE
ncbi:MAG TPA: energy transducer TonB [Pyrinomonadaceae bacterium]|jgi:TonB family protein